MARKVPRHFTSLDPWSKTLPVLLDDEISHLEVAAVLSLAERGQPFLQDEEKMISQQIFPHLSARRHRRKFLLRLTFGIVTSLVGLR